MSRPSILLSITLVLLFGVLSFNAYACLLPLGSITNADMSTGCATPHEQPARQICDAFKTLGIEAPNQDQPAWDIPVLWFGEVVPTIEPSSSCAPLRDVFQSALSPPRLLLVATTVLRI